jgi:glycosyltransferase involved in cell wall biosynthesis
VKTLIVARHTGFGLDQDARILKSALARIDIVAEVARPRDLSLLAGLRRRHLADRIIHVERVHTRWLRAAPEHLVVPNQERFPARKLRALRRVDRVLAKTHHAEDIFARLGLPVSYMGFISEDCARLAQDKDYGRCLHLAGRSTMKGTEDVIAAWARHPEWPELTLVQDPSRPEPEVPANVNLVRRYLDLEEVRALQNACGIHLCPSRSEGFGHYIMEAMSTAALVITTDAPPMNELVDPASGLLVASGRRETRHLGTNYYVDPQALDVRIEEAFALDAEAKVRLGRRARDRFERFSAEFQARVGEIFAEAAASA